MSPTRKNEVFEIVDQVREWPFEDRVGLAAQILSTCQSAHSGIRATPLKNLLGLLKTDGPPPDEEAIRQMLDERRMQKFGG